MILELAKQTSGTVSVARLVAIEPLGECYGGSQGVVGEWTGPFVATKNCESET